MSYASSYATRQRDPRRHLSGVAFVIAFHVLLAWGLANGLARDLVKAIKDPLDVRLIEEVKPIEPPPPPPPPPPVKKILQQPRPAPPPPAYVPPPEVQVEAVQAEPVITVVQQEPPPPAPPAPVAPPAPPAPVVAAIGVTCPNHLDIRSSVPYPPQALRLNKSGEVLVEFIVDTGGAVGDVRVVRSSDPIFNKVVTSAVARFRCVGQGRPVRVTVPFQFALD